MTSSDSHHDLPFLTNPTAIDYVKSSKLMVLVPSSDKSIFQQISETYGKNATCLPEYDKSKQVQEAQAACIANPHIIAVNIGNSSSSNFSDLAPYSQLALDYNYVVSVVNEPESLLPAYVGWHLNEADSCMLDICVHALLDDLLKTIPEFCSDFRNFTGSETIPEMLKYYQLASSNHNGMLHCTAKYFGGAPTSSDKEYFHAVKDSITMSYETGVIGLVFTPRTFGARLKLSADQLKLWGGDDDKKKVSHTPTKDKTDRSHESAHNADVESEDSVSGVCSAMAQHSIQSTKDDLTHENGTATTSQTANKKSTRYFPNCKASLVYLTANATEHPDFHPVTGPGRKAHMTLGVAPGVSAVTTGYDLLEVVELEAEKEKNWPTYRTSRGWLRDYGEGRWVLYMRNKITVDSLFAGVYNFL